MQRVQSKSAPAAIGPYSMAIRTKDLLFASGQIGADPTTGVLAQGIAEQARIALNNLRSVLHDAGVGVENVAQVDVFLADIGDFAAFNAVYETFFPLYKPARLAVAVAGMCEGALVEVRCIACLGESFTSDA